MFARIIEKIVLLLFVSMVGYSLYLFSDVRERFGVEYFALGDVFSVGDLNRSFFLDVGSVILLVCVVILAFVYYREKRYEGK